MRVKPARNPGKKTAQAEGQQLVTGRVDAGGLHGQLVLPDGVENDSRVGIGDFPHDDGQDQHGADMEIIVADQGVCKTGHSGEAEFAARILRQRENDAGQNNRERQGGQRQIGMLQPQAGDADNQPGQDGDDGAQRYAAPRGDVGMEIDQGR